MTRNDEKQTADGDAKKERPLAFRTEIFLSSTHSRLKAVQKETSALKKRTEKNAANALKFLAPDGIALPESAPFGLNLVALKV